MRILIYSITLILSCLLLSQTTNANTYNITRLLSRYDGYGKFNNLLTQTHLADTINNLQVITVLAIGDSSIGNLASKPTEVVRRTLQNHVLLDYYTPYNFKHIPHKSVLATTLYQKTGNAKYGNGHVNITDMGNGEVKLGSGVKGSQLSVSLVKFIAGQPYNLTAFEVSGAIIAPGADDDYIEPAAPPRKMGPTQAPAPAPRKKKHPKSPPALSPETDDSDEPSADGPDADSNSPAPSKSKNTASSQNPITGFSLVVIVAAMLTIFFQ